MPKELKITLQFVAKIAIPLCLVNSIIMGYVPGHLLVDAWKRFAIGLLITFPQAVLYVSIVKWYQRSKEKR